MASVLTMYHILPVDKVVNDNPLLLISCMRWTVDKPFQQFPKPQLLR